MPDDIDPTPDSSGSDDLTAMLLTSTSTPVVEPQAAPNPNPAPDKVDPKPPEPPKPEPKADVKPVPDKVSPKPVTPKEINPDDPKLPAAELRKAYKELKDTSGKTLAQRQADIEKYQAKIKEFEGRRYWSDDDQKSTDSAKAKLAQLQASLYAKDYSKSPEYKEKYIDPANRVYDKALNRVLGMNVKVTDPATQEVTERPATKDDLLQVINAPPQQRYRVAKQLFGEDAHVVTRDADSLQDLDEQARAAIEQKSKGWESEQKQISEKSVKEQQEFQTYANQSAATIADKYPDIFKDDTDPEAKAALERGLKFVSESANLKDAPLAERAARATVIEQWAAAFPRLEHERAKLKAENVALTAELEKLRGSDPGAGGGGEGQHKPDDDEGGTDSMAKQLAEMG